MEIDLSKFLLSKSGSENNCIPTSGSNLFNKFEGDDKLLANEKRSMIENNPVC